MKHYGDITKIHGDKVEPVTVICGGSPCQDLSVAGKRAGLAGERSGLFMEQVRIIREIRNNASNTDGDLRLSGRYAIWENVPGCLSSGSPKGEDFRIVLEEFVKVKYPDTTIPGPPKEGWHKSGCIVADGFSLAWRIHDAQFWGVPQRRRRMCVLVDFDGYTAPDILFDPQLRREAENSESHTAVGHSGGERGSAIQTFRESLSGDSEQSGETRKGSAGSSEDGSGESESG